MNFFPWFILHGFQLVACATTSAAVCNAIAAESEPESSVITDKERRALERVMEINESFHFLHSHKIPLNSGSESGTYRYHAADAEMIESMAEVSTAAFHQSATVSPVILYERPGHIFLDDELHTVCAEFRAMKTSIDPAAYTRQEKFEFLDKISDLGVFTDFGSVSSSPVKGANKKNQIIKEELMFRGIFSASIMPSHFCRDALRLVASVLDSRQIAWLLEHSMDAIVFNPELLDQLENFSMFSDSHVVSAFSEGHYDWFKNPKALRTLKPEALLALFAEMNYDLDSERLELLNSARPIGELFETPEFLEDLLVWQVTAGTPHFRDDHVNIDGLTEFINESEEESLEEEIKSALLGFYIHSEVAISKHFEALLLLRKMPMSYANHNVPTETTEPVTTNLTSNPAGIPASVPADNFSLPPLSVEDVQCNLAEFHFNGLKFIFTHRQAILLSLLKKHRKNDDDGLQNLIGLYVTPSIYSVRNAMKMIKEVKNEYNLVEVRDFVRILNDPMVHTVFSKSAALILAFCESTFDIIKLPYRHLQDTEAKSTSDLIERFRLASLTKEKELEFLSASKWPRIFLIQQLIDFMFSQPFHDHDPEIIKKVFEDYLIFTDLSGFIEFEIGMLKHHVPEHSRNLIEAIEAEKSIEAKFAEFKTEFLIYTKKYKASKENIGEVEKVLKATIAIAAVECRLVALIQNCFKVEMSNFVLEDSELLLEFSDLSHMLKRSQVAELLKHEGGRRLLSEARNFLHNLPTFEDFKASDVKPLKLQAQYATMVRTMPMIPLMISFKVDEFIFNDPVALSWRLFGKRPNTSNELLNLVWRIVPFQMLAESWITGSKKIVNVSLYESGFGSYLKSREVIGKPLEAFKAIIHWIVLQEIKFLEAFLLINSNTSSKWNDALNALVYANHPEQIIRDLIIDTWVHSIATNSEVQTTLRPTFLYEFLEVIGGPLSQLRGGVFLASRQIMDKNLRMVNFGEFMTGFYPWAHKMLAEVRLKPKAVDVRKLPIQSETYTVTGDKIIRDSDKESVSLKNERDEKDAPVKNSDSNSDSNFKFVYNQNTDNYSHTNIPQYREHLEQDIRNRQSLLLQLLSELEMATSGSGAHSQLWSDRVKLLGMFSADGFTLSTSFDLNEPFTHLPLHDMVLFRKLRAFSGVDETETERDFDPAYMATTIIQFAEKVEPKKDEAKKDQKKSKKSKKHCERR